MSWHVGLDKILTKRNFINKTKNQQKLLTIFFEWILRTLEKSFNFKFHFDYFQLHINYNCFHFKLHCVFEMLK